MVLSSRALRDGEVFQVRIDKMVDKWAGSIEIGVTTHNPAYLQLPSTMTNLRSGKRPRRAGPGEGPREEAVPRARHLAHLCRLVHWLSRATWPGPLAGWGPAEFPCPALGSRQRQAGPMTGE